MNKGLAHTYSAWTVRRKMRMANGLCQDCGRLPKRNLISPVCDSCANVRYNYLKAAQEKLRSLGICVACEKQNARSGKSLCAPCAASAVERSRQRRKRTKEFLVSELGGKCAACGEQDIRVLTIDHKNNDGIEHRRGLKTKAGAVFYQKLYRQFRLGTGAQYLLQLLCFNCHAKKDLSAWWTK